MATIVDVLETHFTANTSGFERGAKRVESAARGASRSASLFGNAIGIGVGASLSGAITYSLQAAIGFDTLSRSMIAVTGSAERAKAVLAFVDKLAVPSIFTSDQLGAAARTLEAFGLQSERWLPVVEKLGTVFGGTSQDLNQFTNAIGMLKSGRSGEAFESLARAGISRDALKVRGLKFDKSGQFLGDTRQALDAVEAEINARFGALGQVMGGGAAARIASFGDILNRTARIAGGALLTYLIPVVERATVALEGMLKSGALRKLIEDSIQKAREIGGPVLESIKGIGASLLPVLQGVAKLGGIIAGVFSRLPTGLQQALIIATLLRGVISNIAIPGGLIGGAGGTLGGVVSKAILGPIGLIGSILIAGAMALREHMLKAVEVLELRAAMENAIPEVVRDPETKQLRPPNNEEIEKARREAKRRFFADKYGIDPEAAQEDLDTLLKNQLQEQPDALSPEVKALEQIERNTRPLLDFGQYILGGGELGQLGVTREELAGLKGAGGSPARRDGSVRAAVETLVDVLERHIRNETHQALRNRRMMRVSS